MKKILLPFFCVCVSLVAFSQTSFQKGYIVTSAGDTTTGFLKHDTYSELARSVEFRLDNTKSSAIIYTPRDITAFAFEEGDVFQSVKFIDPTNSNDHKAEFARLALEGYYNLYVLARGLLSHYLVKSSDTSYVLYDDEVDPVMRTVRLGNYRNMLAFLARNCNKSPQEFEKLQFLQRDIMAAVRQLNQCNQSGSVEHRTRAKYENHFVVHAGGSVVQDKLKQLAGGAELRFRNITLSRKLYFITGLHYSKTTDIKFESSYWQPRPTPKEYTTEVFSVPAVLHYTFLEKAVQPYVYLGAAAAYKKANFNSGLRLNGLQGKYGVSLIIGVGIEWFPVPFLAIKADWRNELLLQYPTLGIAFRL